MNHSNLKTDSLLDHFFDINFYILTTASTFLVLSLIAYGVNEGIKDYQSYKKRQVVENEITRQTEYEMSFYLADIIKEINTKDQVGEKVYISSDGSRGKALVKLLNQQGYRAYLDDTLARGMIYLVAFKP